MLVVPDVQIFCTGILVEIGEYSLLDTLDVTRSQDDAKT